MKKMFDCVHPCPCGYFGDSQKACICAPSTVTKYQKRISGPMLDRIDIYAQDPCTQAAKDIKNKRSSNGEAKDVACNEESQSAGWPGKEIFCLAKLLPADDMPTGLK